MQTSTQPQNAWASWFTQSVQTVGDAYLNDVVATQFPAQVGETPANAAPQVIDDDAGKAMAMDDAKQTQRLILAGSGVLLGVALILKLRG